MQISKSNLDLRLIRLALNAAFVVFFFLFSCQAGGDRNNVGENLSGEDSKDKVSEGKNSLYEEVMAVHDAIMPAMSDLIALNRELKRKLEKENGPVDTVEIKQLSAELEAANESMMDWMRKFNPDLTDKTSQQVNEYLTSQKKKIEEVREKMEAARAKAEEYIQSH